MSLALIRKKKEPEFRLRIFAAMFLILFAVIVAMYLGKNYY